MENVTHALFLAFAMFTLVLGLSYGIHLLSSMNLVTNTLIQTTDATADYQSVSYDSSDTTKDYSRIVGSDTVISTLYKYYKENFSVEIYNNENKLVQIFDLTIENKLADNNNNKSDKEWDAYNKLYGDGKSERFDPGTQTPYLFKAPWRVNHDAIKQRIDMYISGQKGYINETLVDYSEKNNFKTLIENGDTFKEQFIQYSFKGDTISSGPGEDVDTVIGSARPIKKILIRYVQQ